MKGVKFNDIHSYRNLNLILSGVSIPPATPKTTYVDVPGADGSLDQTEALGEVKFNNRDCEFLFSVLPTDDFEEKKTEVSNLLNGKVCKITLDKDADYYYQGRCTVEKYKCDKMLRQITVKAKVHPYKLKQDVTTKSWTISKTKNLADRLNLWQSNNAETASGFVINDVASIIPISGKNRYIHTNISLNGDEKALSISCDTKNHYIRCFFTFRDSSGIAISSDVLDLVDGKFEGLTVPENARVLWFRVFPHVSYGKVIFSKIQIEVGTSVTDYVPKDGFLAVNDRKPIIPIITVSNDNTTITTGNATATLSAGQHKILDFKLQYGENIINATGSGTVTLTYQEGAL